MTHTICFPFPYALYVSSRMDLAISVDFSIYRFRLFKLHSESLNIIYLFLVVFPLICIPPALYIANNNCIY